MSIRKVVAGLLITAGIAIMAVPFFWRATGEKQTEQLISEFEQTLEDDYDEETNVEEEQTSISEEDEAIFKEGGIIGIIEIPGIDIRYPVMEGTTSKVLNAGIGHIEETAGIAIMAVPFFWRATGEKQTEQLISEFEQTLEDDYDEETDVEEEQTSISEEDEAILKEGGVIGIIEIPGLDIRYPVMEGTTSKVLNAGIGHIEETAGIGESGNCVLCGHNGSRYGTFFTPLSQISIGDEVMITDKNGLKHIYEVTETDVVNPYDNSIKTQGDEKELTLFTCSQKGTMRFVVRCIYKEAVMDE